MCASVCVRAGLHFLWSSCVTLWRLQSSHCTFPLRLPSVASSHPLTRSQVADSRDPAAGCRRRRLSGFVSSRSLTARRSPRPHGAAREPGGLPQEARGQGVCKCIWGVRGPGAEAKGFPSASFLYLVLELSQEERQQVLYCVVLAQDGWEPHDDWGQSWLHVLVRVWDQFLEAAGRRKQNTKEKWARMMNSHHGDGPTLADPSVVPPPPGLTPLWTTRAVAATDCNIKTIYIYKKNRD